MKCEFCCVLLLGLGAMPCNYRRYLFYASLTDCVDSDLLSYFCRLFCICKCSPSYQENNVNQLRPETTPCGTNNKHYFPDSGFIQIGYSNSGAIHAL